MTISHSFSRCCHSFWARAATFFGHGREYSVASRIHLSPLFVDNDAGLKDCKIELIDDETWQVSSGLKDAWIANEKVEAVKTRPLFCNQDDDGSIQMVNSVTLNRDEHDFDDIEDMRIRRNLFYELNKESKEYEEYKFDFHRRKSLKEGKEKRKNKENKKKETSSPGPLFRIEETLKNNPAAKMKNNKDDKTEESSSPAKNQLMIDRYHLGDSSAVKKQRVPTFKQLTAPYHEPFCLDIYISKGSVRASIIHRATSNVVAVSHSISKDMKFELGSSKNRIACSSVGAVLARRALADDIHNVIYTPKKGEKSVEKVQIVLKSLVDGGIDVKVKPKQTKLKRGDIFGPRTGDHT
ncbi:hypothetical protein F511_23100 [Dorcoceras hygrometricum]|uniref:Uncharacterized protein n=1 Tax=Dorcoceras hygrometricum TaxID=472368 RepID=A0A2Z7A7Y9_9LAMI|nr:hypothetical protein F511_23100 [Dorcoceras hygrometricum]